MGELKHDTENQRYILTTQNGQEAYIDYALENKDMRLTYSFVPDELRGKKIGKELVEKTFEMLTDEGFTATAVCSYISVVALRHPKWSTLIN
ncbi:MAG: putative GNAT family acetyltransferase [Flavobacteriaceae bacterium]|jgi:predicted GNAT family acetyltransferase